MQFSNINDARGLEVKTPQKNNMMDNMINFCKNVADRIAYGPQHKVYVANYINHNYVSFNLIGNYGKMSFGLARTCFARTNVDDIYQHVDAVLKKFSQLKNISFYCTYRGKILRCGHSLEDYGCPLELIVDVHLMHLQGGSNEMPKLDNIIFPNEIVRQCEKQVVKEVPIALTTIISEMIYHVQNSDVEDNSMLILRKIATQFLSNSFIDIDKEWILKQIENLCIILHMHSKCSSINDYQFLLITSCRLFTDAIPTVYIAKKIEKLFEDEVQSSAEDAVKKLRGIFEGAISFQDNKLVKKLINLYSFLLTQGFLSKIGITLNDEDYSRFEQRNYINNFSSKKGFLLCVVDLSLHFCERYFEYLKTGELSTFLNTEANLDKWFKEADRIISLGPFVGNLAAHNTSYFSFIGDLNDVIERGTAYAKYASKSLGTSDNIITRKLHTLQLLKNTEITRKAAQQERTAPMGVLIYGHSSVAKSAFTKMLFNYYGALFDLDRDDQYRYVRNPMDEYWSNFDTSKWCVQLDDIAFLHPAKTTSVDSTLQDLLNVVNNVPYVPPQAALEDKGKTPVLAKLVLATSNSKDLNANEYFWCPLAVRRRLPYVINIEPRKEYLHQNQVFIEPSKLELIDGEFPDWWRIHVQKIVPVMDGQRERARLETVAIFENTNQFLQHFGKACLEHENNQSRAMRKNDDMQTIAVCKKCLAPLPHDNCFEVQSYDKNITTYMRNIAWEIFEWWIQLKYIYYFLSWLATFSLLRKFIYRNIMIRCNNTLQQQFYTLSLRNGNSKQMQMILICLGFLSVCLTAYYTYNMKKDKNKQDNTFKMQGNLNNTVETDLPKTERTNVWYNPVLELNEFDVPNASKSMANFDKNDVRDLLSNNCVLLAIRGKGTDHTRWMRGVFTRGHFLLTNKHAFENEFDSYKVTIYKVSVGQSLGPNHTIYVDRSDIAFSSDSDVAMLEVRSMPPFKDITYIWCEKDLPLSTGIELTREEDGTVAINEVFSLTYVAGMDIPNHGKHNIYHGIGTLDTKSGMCGSLAVGMTPRGPIIMGIHMLGKGKHAGFILITKKVIDELECSCRFSDKPIIQGKGKPLLGLKEDVKLIEPHHKSIFRWMEVGTVNVYGSFAGFRPKPKSRVCTTPLVNEITNHYNIKVNHGKPFMEGWEPWRKNVVEMVKPNVHYDRNVLKKCVEGYTKDILNNLPQGWESQLVILSDKASVNGLPGVIFIDGINRKSSMGFPWNTSKQRFLFDEKDDKYPDGCNFSEDVWQRVRHIESCYANNQRAYPVFTGHLKDEPTTFAKIEAKKTRLFTGAPVDWSLVVRKNLLSFVRLVQLNKHTFEAGPGMVTQSKEWSELHDYLCAHGDNQIVAGDYGKFDKRMIADFILAAFDVILNVYRAAGYSDEELKCISGIAEDTAFPLSNLSNDLVEFYGTNPSGHPLTVIINSLVNALYMRYCYVRLNPQHHCLDFKENVNLMTYGDDNVMGVNCDVPWFNHTAIQSQLAVIGVEYTMADKESESVPYIHISEVSFLKRTWRYDAEIGYWMAPLEEASIMKSLTTWVPSGTIDKYAQMVAVLSSANNEYFFYGRDIFNKQRDYFLSLVEKEPYKHYVQESHFPDYDQLVERFRRASEQLDKERSC